ncbi:MAG: hypothetical protein FD138_2742, partial [Planctomycetota bacterium]
MKSAVCKVKNECKLVFCTLHFALCTLHFAVAPLVTDQRVFAEESSNVATDLDPSWLQPTKHPQTGLLSRSIRPEEATGYFAILNHARQLPLLELKSTAKQFQAERLAVIRRDPDFRPYFRKPDAEFPTFADLFRHPESYHGRLVTFRGHLRRLISSSAGENAHGLQQLHEAWLYVDGAQQNPVVVVCTELPPNIPTGSDILVDFVSATGYFFKRYGYEDRSGQPRFAPLILAQRLEWTPRPQRSELLSSGMMFGLTLGTGLVV